MLLHDLVTKFEFSEDVHQIKILNYKSVDITEIVRNPKNFTLLYENAYVYNFTFLNNQLVVIVTF